MGPKQEYIWADYPEPHAERKRKILAKHGKGVNKLMGYEPRTKYIIFGLVTAQLWLGIATQSLGWASYLLVAYVVGGTLNHALFLGIHEVTHNLAFKKPLPNDLLACVANLPIGIPYSMMFKIYHAEHHRYQGWDGIDTDIPSEVEAKLFSTTLSKLFFATFQILFYAIRPCMLRQPNIGIMVFVNWAIQLSFNYVYIMLTPAGIQGWLYLVLSTFMAGTLTPHAGHFISEHYVFDPTGKQETYSYYGPLNKIMFNVGYHNEHHDFPNVPWSRLAALKDTAPEFYDNLEVTKSWPGTIYDFITNPKVSAWSRVKRERGAWMRKNLIATTPQAE